MSPEIILASSSLVRRDVFNKLGIIYTVRPSKFEEKTTLEGDESFEDLAKRLALGKARNIASRMQNAIVIGADSFAVLDGKIMGKPHTKECAIEYLYHLNGKTHEFYTGVAVIDTEKQKEVVDCVTARVRFRNLSQNEIEQYVQKEDVTTAGGAYRIQGLGATLIEKIEGDYYAIVGLSPSKLQEMLKSLGHNLFDYAR